MSDLSRFCRCAWLLLNAGVMVLTVPAHAAEPSAQTQSETGSTPPDQDRYPHPFDRAWLVGHALELSQQPFALQELQSDSPLTNMDYDDYRRITFDRNAAIWARENRNFTIDLFHPGFLFKTPVLINLVVAGTSRRVLFTSDIFKYDEEVAQVKDASAPGYSGFRVYHPDMNTQRLIEFMVFQGASYFRAAGHDQYYGLSARGIAINTARPVGEEFPYFTEFWIERPPVGADKLVIHALLESQSLTGAYTFTITKNEYTVMEVESDLFIRNTMDAYGIAPLTSMFLFDGTNRVRFDDYRPAVHDSDGLLIQQSNQEQIWRPLANPVRLQVSAFTNTNPKGFGLMQRSRNFSDFDDPEAHYEKRAALWIEPLDDWGKGHVELVEIPSGKEINDNIVAYWQPATPMLAGQTYGFRYRMYWGQQAPVTKAVGSILNTSAGKVPDSTEQLFVIDYSTDTDITEALKIDAQTSAGKVTDVSGHVVWETGNYRLYLKIDPGDANLSELQIRLSVNGKPWGETWLYRWTR